MAARSVSTFLHVTGKNSIILLQYLEFMAQKQTKVSAPESQEKPDIAGKPKSNGKLILIVEDERPLAHALEMKLKGQGYETQVATNGSDALAELKKKNFALVLLDLIMPVMDGFAVLEEMKKEKIKVPVIVLSNLGQDEDRAKAKSLGAIDYFVKSNTPIAEILVRVKAAV